MSLSEQTETVGQRLLVSVAEELKLPLLQIAREAELAQSDSLSQIRATAEHALWLVDSLLLVQSVQREQLQLVPVTVSSVLYDVAHVLESIAKQYDCRLELDITGRYVPVLANRQLLESAFVGLGGALITAIQADTPSKRIVRLSAHKTKQGIVTGCFADSVGLSEVALEKGRKLYGKARQPLKDFSSQAGAGVFIADTLFSAMQTPLRIARHHGQQGLAVTLTPSSQLALV
jgi:light-regulated signal transduction histidine kinase (bacteriophytochrome)